MNREIKAPRDKDELIVRQSQMERAIDVCKLLEYKPTLIQLLRISQVLTQFIFDWDLKNPDLRKLSSHIADPSQNELVTQIETILKDK